MDAPNKQFEAKRSGELRVRGRIISFDHGKANFYGKERSESYSLLGDGKFIKMP